MSSHVFVDETKRRGYLLVASAVVPSDLDATRRMLRGLVLPGQRRLHMKDESDPRKRCSARCDFPVLVVIPRSGKDSPRSLRSPRGESYPTSDSEYYEKSGNSDWSGTHHREPY